jgi:hypothetical protein
VLLLLLFGVDDSGSKAARKSLAVDLPLVVVVLVFGVFGSSVRVRAAGDCGTRLFVAVQAELRVHQRDDCTFKFNNRHHGPSISLRTVYF